MRCLQFFNRYICGTVVLILIIIAGLYVSIQGRFVQIRLFPKALKSFARQITGTDDDKSGTTAHQALCTALAATVGVGNLAGVAGAIAIGGPGAIFWMWICGILGMATKFAEATMAVRFRVLKSPGEFSGGPMYMIERGLPKGYRWLGKLYCMFGIIASFGVGNAAQVNAMVTGINGIIVMCKGRQTIWGDCVIGAVIALSVLVMLLGGMKQIGKLTERLVPVASVFYIALCLGVLLLRFNRIPNALTTICLSAFSPRSVTGGVVGSAFIAISVGAARGVFTNEAGLGTASIAHASANVSHPVEQGLMGIIEVFLDTIVICTMTALVILCSGVEIPYGEDMGIGLTSDAFAGVYGSWVRIPIAVSLCLFAIATILGWSFYGGRCAQYLFGNYNWKPFVGMQICAVLLGVFSQTDTIWLVSEISNALMAIPNLFALIMLSPELKKLVSTYSVGG